MMRAGPVVALIISVSEAANVRPRVYPLHGVACESEGDDEQLELGHDPMDLSWPRAEQIERCLATCAGMEDCAFFHVMTSVATDLDDCVSGGGSVETCAPWGECVYFSQCVPMSADDADGAPLWTSTAYALEGRASSSVDALKEAMAATTARRLSEAAEMTTTSEDCPAWCGNGEKEWWQRCTGQDNGCFGCAECVPYQCTWRDTMEELCGYQCPPDTPGTDKWCRKYNDDVDGCVNAYAKRKGVQGNALRFLLDGQRINATQTPEELEMEDGDVIDVMVEQQGD